MVILEQKDIMRLLRLLDALGEHLYHDFRWASENGAQGYMDAVRERINVLTQMKTKLEAGLNN